MRYKRKQFVSNDPDLAQSVRKCELWPYMQYLRGSLQLVQSMTDRTTARRTEGHEDERIDGCVDRETVRRTDKRTDQKEEANIQTEGDRHRCCEDDENVI